MTIKGGATNIINERRKRPIGPWSRLITPELAKEPDSVIDQLKALERKVEVISVHHWDAIESIMKQLDRWEDRLDAIESNQVEPEKPDQP